MKLGIMATGGIAKKMAQTIKNLNHKEIELYAIASRNLDKAQDFAKNYDIPVAYGSYQELASDPQVDLIYIATPHSEHHLNAKLCLEHNKPMLIEKAFTANAKMAKEILEIAKQKHVLVAEAIWTRYMPSRKIIQDALDAGKIGTVHSLSANLGYPISKVPRIIQPELAGGALLDLGVYPINFAMMFFGHEIKEITGTCIKGATNVDMLDNITLVFKDNKIANLHACALGPTDRSGIIYGSTGYMVITNINNPEKIEIFDKEHRLVETLEIPTQVSGYEYQVVSCLNALKAGQDECAEMTHKEIVDVMEVMDNLRQQWQIKYPFE